MKLIKYIKEALNSLYIAFNFSSDKGSSLSFLILKINKKIFSYLLPLILANFVNKIENNR
jgi:hypothetical protein